MLARSSPPLHMSHTGGQQSLPVLLHLELSQPGGDSDATADSTASRSMTRVTVSTSNSEMGKRPNRAGKWPVAGRGWKTLTHLEVYKTVLAFKHLGTSESPKARVR